MEKKHEYSVQDYANSTIWTVFGLPNFHWTAEHFPLKTTASANPMAKAICNLQPSSDHNGVGANDSGQTERDRHRSIKISLDL